ncbi:MAG: SWIM zinc finger family protein, partial [Tannerella sp.]|nr:SWIM zinc finger family protein [Tannerella sp.]
MSIIDLQETAAGAWQAKYRGNYGTYTIKIKTEGNKITNYSCSCPSNYSPCKHIAMIKEAVDKRVAKNKKHVHSETTVEQLLKDVPLQELRDFVDRQTLYNQSFKNAFMLEFAPKAKTNERKNTDYAKIIRDALSGVYFYEEELFYQYHDGEVEIDILEQWIRKAEKYLNPENVSEAVRICKACIEEYASWIQNQGEFILDYLYNEYPDRLFDLLEQAVSMKDIDNKALYAYCKEQMKDPKYETAGFSDYFDKLFSLLAQSFDVDDYIALQDKLLSEIPDKSSEDAQKLLQRKIDFYRFNNEPDKAWYVIEQNLQIESFRKEWTDKLIDESRYTEAKKLINEYISANKSRYITFWYELKLTVAQKEKDIKAIRSVSFHFIEEYFTEHYYNLYKSTFSEKEWAETLPMLMKRYEQMGAKNFFNKNIADVLLAEKKEEQLMNYVGRYLSVNTIERYYKGFSSFPENTLDMFRKAIDQYA